MSSNVRTWRVGELATATDVTVRTLRHYDEIGLLRASARTESRALPPSPPRSRR